MEYVVLMRGTAIAEGHGDTALVLLKAGAETDKKDATGALALDLAPDAKVSLLELLKLAEVLICLRSGTTSSVLPRRKVSSYDDLGAHLLNQVPMHRTTVHFQLRAANVCTSRQTYCAKLPHTRPIWSSLSIVRSAHRIAALARATADVISRWPSSFEFNKGQSTRPCYSAASRWSKDSNSRPEIGAEPNRQIVKTENCRTGHSIIINTQVISYPWRFPVRLV